MPSAIEKSAIFAFFLLLVPATWTQDLMCCSHTTGSCRNVCEKISLVKVAADLNLRAQAIQEVQEFCSPQLSTFWECLNATFRDMARGDSWSGRVCCPLPHSDSCRRACVTATSIYDLSQGCRRSDELAFFSCLDRQEKGEHCCNHARDEECRDICLEIYRNQGTPTKSQRQKVHEVCENNDHRVFECVKDYIKVTPAKDLYKMMPCCAHAKENRCLETCKRMFSVRVVFREETIDGLIQGGCGMPLPQDPFWNCLLSLSSNEPVENSDKASRIDRVGIDSAKWHCCQRAVSHQCQRLCAKTFTRFWATSWDEFHGKCLSKPSEHNLRSCIDEVDEPCELGCDGLSFCTNFNNRPTELFRSCNSAADDAARSDVAAWQHLNMLTLPGLELPLKNISQCSPNEWKAIACILQIKPCSHHGNQICRDVCLNILSECVDWSSVLNHSPESICAMWSPQDPDTPCIQVEKFLAPPQHNYQLANQEVFSPCKGNPCEAHEICLPNRNCSGGKCLQYRCDLGCKLGEVSEFMVPEGTYVRLPIANANVKNPEGCLKICKCHGGKIGECQPLPCFSLTPCILGSTHPLHGSSFEMECNHCTCFAGELICSKKQCESTALSGQNTGYTSLPCNCWPHYVPVCGRDGNTYPSACLAKCADLNDSDFEHGPCEDPCLSNKCPTGQKCVPKPQICLSLKHKPCKQFECVNGTINCRNLPRSPVCDVDNREHKNLCHLVHSNVKLAYLGPCLKNCRHEGRVCGINGRTYDSECAAWADMVSVDYSGPCMAVGLIARHKVKRCPNVNCPPLPFEGCLGITPPGACCPLCGGAMRLLYSRKQIDRALYALQQKDTEALTLRAMLKALERQVQVAQCVLRGYLTVEQDVFVAVQSTERRPSRLQLEACVGEAEKIASLINIQSSRIASELSLSSLRLATLVHTAVNAGVRVAAGAVFLLVWMVLV